MPVESYLSLGSNLGNRRQNLVNALVEINRKCSLTAISSLYETEPIGFTEQEEFYNLVVQLYTEWDATTLLQEMQQIETNLGRKRIVRWGPRIIDIDILTFGAHIIKTAQLELPHSQVSHRRFVLQPWAEIASAFTVPGFNKTVLTLLNETEDHTMVKKILSADKLESLVKKG